MRSEKIHVDMIRKKIFWCDENKGMLTWSEKYILTDQKNISRYDQKKYILTQPEKELQTLWHDQKKYILKFLLFLQ